MSYHMEIAMRLDLGSPAGQFKVMPLDLGPGKEKAFVAFYSACYDIDAHYDLFVWPKDGLHAIAFTERGETLWRKEMDIVPGSAYYCFYVIDMDGDGVDEIYVVNNKDPEHPFSVKNYVMQRLSAVDGSVTGEWPWPNYGGIKHSMWYLFRNHIFGGRAGGKPILVTAQGTYGDMFFQAWNPNMSARWTKTILESDPGARGSHSFPVGDINGDNSDEVMWGERCISLDDGRELFCIEKQNWNGHSDNCQPVYDEAKGRWMIWINRESDEQIGPRVGMYDTDGNPIWTDVDWGHIHKGWTGRIGPNGELLATAMRITGQSKNAVGRYYTGITEFVYDAMTGVPVKMPFSLFDTAPVDIDGDGLHEILRGVAAGGTVLLDRQGNTICELGGKVAMNSKIIGLPGEQVMVYEPDGIVKIWCDRNAEDSERALRRYQNPFYLRNQYSRNIENNLCMLGGI